MLSFTAVVFVAACLELYGAAKLELNSRSTVFKDVVSVVHNAEEREVQITMQPKRRCKSPTFIVRLSGTTLSLADLVDHSDTTYTYKYPCILDPGKYFLEIIVLFCTEFNPSNYTDICMESVFNTRNVVNLPFGTTLSAQPDCEMRPRWKTSRKVGTVSKVPVFLPTRHQRNITELTSVEYCNTGIIVGFCNPSKVDLTEYTLYQWIGAPNWRAPLASALALAVTPTNPVVHVCYVGDSHSMHLMKTGLRIPGGRNGLTHDHIMRAVPSMFNVSSFAEHKCSVAVISFGQWMFGNGKRCIATTREKYAAELRKMIAHGGLTKDAGPTKVYFRTENFNGLGYRYSACPPLDYRSIPAIRMLNDVIRELSVELNLNFIDLTHIQMVHWDSAPDFNHPAQNVFDAQLQWILHHIFRDVVSTNTSLTTYAAHDVPVGLPVHDAVQYRVVLNEALTALDQPV